MRTTIEDDFDVKTHLVGTVDQDHVDSQAFASASESHEEPGGAESHFRQCVD